MRIARTGFLVAGILFFSSVSSIGYIASVWVVAHAWFLAKFVLLPAIVVVFVGATVFLCWELRVEEIITEEIHREVL